MRRTIAIPVTVLMLMSALPSQAPGAAAERVSGDPAVPLSHSGWTQYRFDAARTGFNRFETVLGPSNVAGLVELWSFQSGGPISCSPTVASGFVHVNSSDGRLYTLLRSTGQLAWSSPMTVADPCGGVAVDPTNMYMGTSTGSFLALRATDGVQVWEYLPGGPTVSPALTRDFEVIVYEVDGTIFAERVDRSGFPVWSVNLGEGFIHSPPAAWGGMVFITTTTDANTATLFALNAENGLLRWTFQPPAPSFGLSDPSVTKGTVFVTDGNGVIHAIDAFTGEVIWTQEPSPPRPGPTDITVGRVNVTAERAEPQASRLRVFVAGAEGDLRVVDAKTGALLLDLDLESPAGGPLTLANGVLYVPADDGILRALDAATGQTLWASEATGGPITSAPTVVNGRVFVSLADGTVRAYGLPGS